MIQGLYDVNAREPGLDAAAQTAHRQSQAVSILEVIKKYLDNLTESEVFPRSD